MSDDGREKRGERREERKEGVRPCGVVFLILYLRPGLGLRIRTKRVSRCALALLCSSVKVLTFRNAILGASDDWKNDVEAAERI
jgi:hypothetical protein